MAAQLNSEFEIVILICLMAGVGGCGGTHSNMAEVRGRVLLDGKALTSGSVMTLPDSGPGANGIINAQGEFSLTTRETVSGASVGKHHIAVVALEVLANFSPEAPRKSLIPQRYASPETSGLTIDVEADEPNEVVLELTSKP
jgi:hypothetical protein